jgi:hypothetical protein
MQQKITRFFYDFADALTLYDYLGFVLLFLLFILCIVLAVVSSQKLFTSLFFAFLSFMLLIAGPFGVKIGFDHFIRANDVTITKFQTMHYSDSLLIQGSITNNGKIDFSHCKITLKAVKSVQNEYLQMLYNFKPYATKVIQSADIPINEVKKFEAVIDEFTLKEGFTVIGKGACYP